MTGKLCQDLEVLQACSHTGRDVQIQRAWESWEGGQAWQNNTHPPPKPFSSKILFCIFGDLRALSGGLK